MYGSPHKSKLKLIDLSDDTEVSSGGGTNAQTLTPPEGMIYIVRNIRLQIPDPNGSSSGDHKILAYLDASPDLNWFYIKSNTGGNITIGASGSPYHFYGSANEFPSDDAEQMDTVTNKIIASNDYPVTFMYTNSTDANQAGNRQFELLVEEIPERQ